MKIRKFIIILVLLSICIVTFAHLNKNEEKTKIQITTTTKCETKYTLKEFNGMLAVFENNSSKPREVYNISIKSFPEEDVIKLQKGITVNNEDELNKLLEDYTS